MGPYSGTVMADQQAWASAVPWICGAVSLLLALQIGHAPFLFAVACALALLISWLVARSS